MLGPCTADKADLRSQKLLLMFLNMQAHDIYEVTSTPKHPQTSHVVSFIVMAFHSEFETSSFCTASLKAHINMH